eukprot:15479067-Alexandrium_andersonii.AAC.1
MSRRVLAMVRNTGSVGPRAASAAVAARRTAEPGMGRSARRLRRAALPPFDKASSCGSCPCWP